MPIFNHPLPSPLPSRLWPSLGLALTIAGLPHVQASGKGDSKAAPPSSASASDPARFDPGPPAKDRYECAEPGPPPDWRGKRPPMEAIRPHARLAGADLSGMKLWFKDLRHIDFQDADLRDADFHGSDLSGAALYGVKGLGANFTDACLAMARTEGAQDLDFGKARVHSFFHWEPADRAGTTKLCRLDDGRLRHVLEHHRWLAANNKGQFYLGHCTEDGILALVLDGWRRSGEPGKVKREYEPDDHCHTPVELAGEVGAYCSYEGWRATRCVEIVARKEWREINGKMMEVQAVKSVFPVSRSRAGF